MLNGQFLLEVEEENYFPNGLEEGAPPPIGSDEVRAARRVLERYKSAKAALDARLVENEEWFRLRHGGRQRPGGSFA